MAGGVDDVVVVSCVGGFEKMMSSISGAGLVSVVALMISPLKAVTGHIPSDEINITATTFTNRMNILIAKKYMPKISR